MDRRAFVVGSVAALFAPLAAEAQHVGKVYRLAIVYPVGSTEAMKESILLPELQRRGYVEGRNLHLERLSAGGQRERYRDVAREAVARKPDVIFAPSGRMAEACRAITSTIPIVTITADPVSLGLAAKLREPGGNVTGFTMDAGLELHGKWLELLNEAGRRAERVAFLVTEQGWKVRGSSMRDAAHRVGAAIIAVTVKDPIGEREYRRAFALMKREGAEAVIVSDHVEILGYRDLIVQLAAEAALPAIYAYRAFVEAGGLMAYAVDQNQMRLHVADYIDRIFKGARSADLPFQQPTKFELLINLKTAKALGLTIPPSLLLRADQVIE